MKRRHLVIGAGISGLSLGWFLKKRFGDAQSLTILEARSRPGGWIRSREESGFLFEDGPRSCRSKGAGTETLRLAEELGLCDEVICASPEAKRRYLYCGGRLQQVPTGFLSFLTSPLTKGVIPALWKERRIPPSDFEDESIADFFSRRLNAAIAEKLIDPLIAGIYAGDIRQLSLRSCFPEFHRWEQEHGSLVKGMFKKRKAQEIETPFVQNLKRTPIFSFKKGMETLVQALYCRLSDHVKLNSPVKILRKGKEAVEAVLWDGQVIEADRVFLAIPAYAAGSLLEIAVPDAAELMAKTTYASVASVNMGWKKQVLQYKGFGYLVPSMEKQEALGCVFNSSAFAAQNNSKEETRLTVMFGGMHHPDVEHWSEESTVHRAEEAIRSHLDILSRPDAVHVQLAKQAIPQYTLGHQVRLAKIEERLNHALGSLIFLTGSAWRGVAVNDCVAEAKIVTGNLIA